MIARILSGLILSVSLFLYIFIPSWGLSNLVFGIGVGIIALILTMVKDKTRFRKICSILLLPLALLWYFFEPGFEPVISIIAFFTTYPWSIEGKQKDEKQSSQNVRLAKNAQVGKISQSLKGNGKQTISIGEKGRAKDIDQKQQ